MNRTLDVSQELKNFDGTTIVDAGKSVRLKDIVLAYLAQVHAMRFQPVEEGMLYELGMKIGQSKGEVELDQHQWDILKRVCDSGKVWQGQEQLPLFSILITQQAKHLVDAAVPVVEK